MEDKQQEKKTYDAWADRLFDSNKAISVLLERPFGGGLIQAKGFVVTVYLGDKVVGVARDAQPYAATEEACKRACEVLGWLA